VNPDNEYTVLHAKQLSKAREGYESIQVHPQRVSLKLRIGKSTFEPIDYIFADLKNFSAEAYRFTMDYAQAEDYPVDLYYLMDLSKSMEDDKDKLSELGDLLADTMQNITSNFRLGFGSFVDKVVMPYVSTVPKK
jgi:integrin beta 1